MPTCSVSSRAELEQEVRQLLHKLELPAATTPAGIKKHFRSLIKKYHPDQQKQAQPITLRRSQEIIAAYKRLLELIEAFPRLQGLQRDQNPAIQKAINSNQSGRTAAAMARQNWSANAAVASGTQANAQFQFQVFESTEACYAIPVQAIERITAPGQQHLNTMVNNQSICFRPLYSHGVSPHYLESHQLEWQKFRYIILLRQAGKQLLGLALADGLAPGRIIQVDPGRASMYNPGGRSPGLFFSANGRQYFCPDDLALQFLIHKSF